MRRQLHQILVEAAERPKASNWDLLKLANHLDGNPGHASFAFPAFRVHLDLSYLADPGAPRTAPQALARAQKAAISLHSVFLPSYTGDARIVLELKAAWMQVWLWVMELIDFWLLVPAHTAEWPRPILGLAIAGCVQALRFATLHDGLQTDETTVYTCRLWMNIPRFERLADLRGEMTAWPLALNSMMARNSLLLAPDSQDNPQFEIMQKVAASVPASQWIEAIIAHMRQDLARNLAKDGENKTRLVGSNAQLLQQFSNDEGVLAAMPWLVTIPLVNEALEILSSAPYFPEFLLFVASCSRHISHATMATNGDKWLYIALKGKFLFHLSQAARQISLGIEDGSEEPALVASTLEQIFEDTLIPHLVHWPVLRVVDETVEKIKQSPVGIDPVRSILTNSWGRLERVVDDWGRLSRNIRTDILNSRTCHNPKCFIGESKYRLCSGCRTAWYCCRRCQKHDWKYGGHRDWCKKEQVRWKAAYTTNDGPGRAGVCERAFWRKIIGQDLTRYTARILQIAAEQTEIDGGRSYSVKMDYRSLPATLSLPNSSPPGMDAAWGSRTVPEDVCATAHLQIFFRCGPEVRQLYMAVPWSPSMIHEQGFEAEYGA